MLLADLILNSVHFEDTIPSYSNSDQHLFRTRFTNEALSHSHTTPQFLQEGKGQQDRIKEEEIIRNYCTTSKTQLLNM